MLVWRSAFSFGWYSSRNTVPKIMKDPKFTKTGIVYRKRKAQQYDLSQPHIVNPHLYVDKKEDSKALRKER